MSAPGAPVASVDEEAALVSSAPHRPRPRRLLLAGTLLLAVFAAMGVAVALRPESSWSQGIDDAWRAAVGVGPDSTLPGTPIAMFFQNFGQLPGLVTFALLLPLILVLLGRWRSAIFVFAVQFAGPGLLSQLAKNLVDRPRPATDAVAGLFGPLFTVDHGSFPSGHAVSAAIGAVTVLALVPPSRRALRVMVLVLGAVLIIGMIWQRTLINAHWLSDTVAGTIAGLGTALLLWWAFWPWLQRDHGRRPWFLRRRTAPAAV